MVVAQSVHSSTVAGARESHLIWFVVAHCYLAAPSPGLCPPSVWPSTLLSFSTASGEIFVKTNSLIQPAPLCKFWPPDSWPENCMHIIGRAISHPFLMLDTLRIQLFLVFQVWPAWGVLLSLKGFKLRTALTLYHNLWRSCLDTSKKVQLLNSLFPFG